MVKVCEKQFPKGSNPKQKSDGFYMDGYLKENLDILAEKIADDQQFVILISGSGQVRVGKSVLAQQIGSYLTYKVREMHRVRNNKFDLSNIVFKAKDLKKKALELPKYSVVTLDEGDDLTEHYLSALSKELRKFFRKCGQLNQFIILLLPDFFELPRSYAITRSICLVDVHFYKKFERGYFKFYNFKAKKNLYLRGKKFSDYDIVNPNFSGRFTNFYTVNETAYRSKKWRDLSNIDEAEEKTITQKLKDNNVILFKKLYQNLGLTIAKLAQGFGISLRTAHRWLDTKDKMTGDNDNE